MAPRLISVCNRVCFRRFERIKVSYGCFVGDDGYHLPDRSEPVEGVVPSFKYMQIHLRTLQDPLPWHLLLNADPSVEQINTYLPKSLCYLAFLEQHCVGVLVLV